MTYPKGDTKKTRRLGRHRASSGTIVRGTISARARCSSQKQGDSGHEGTGGYITCVVATANGFAQPYRAKIVVHQDKPESGLDFDVAARRESLVARLRGLPEKTDANS